MDIDSVVSQRTWRWLLDLSKRLNIAFELLGPTGSPLLPAVPTAEGSRMREFVSGDDSFRRALDDAWRLRTTRFAVCGSLQLVCAPLESTGAIVIGKETDSDAESQRWRPELERIAEWYVTLLQDAATTQLDELSVEPYRVRSLDRILNEAAARGVTRGVLGAFVEVFAVWDDVQVIAYAATPSGRYMRFAAPIGQSGAAPSILSDDGFGSGELMRLSTEDAERLQLRGSAADVLVQQLTCDGRAHWLLVFIGNVRREQEPRIAIYVALLRETLHRLLTDTAARTSEVVNRRPFPQPGEPLEPAAEGIAAELMELVGADSCALAMGTRQGRQILAVGRTELLSPSDTESNANRLTITAFDADASIAFVANRDHSNFTVADSTLARIACGSACRWLRKAFDQSAPFERRHRTRSTDAAFDELAQDAVRHQQHVSVAVVSLGCALLRPGAMQSCVAKVREQIRSCDFAGALNDSEIALLLCDMNGADAGVIAARLVNALASGPDGALIRPVMGIANAAPGNEMPDSLIQAARANFPSVA